MTEYADKEICERLLKLSGNWGIKDKNITRRWSRNGVGDWFLDLALPWVHDGQIPAYTLAFILDKLPKRIDVHFDMMEGETRLSAYWGQDDYMSPIIATTPTNAAALLACTYLNKVS